MHTCKNLSNNLQRKKYITFFSKTLLSAFVKKQSSNIVFLLEKEVIKQKSVLLLFMLMNSKKFAVLHDFLYTLSYILCLCLIMKERNLEFLEKLDVYLTYRKGKNFVIRQNEPIFFEKKKFFLLLECKQFLIISVICS